MPVEEDVFYDINGYEVSRTNLVQQMIDYYNDKLALGETAVTDFNEGSEIRNLLEAIAVDVYNLMEDQQDLTTIAFVSTAWGEWLDMHGANPFIQLARNTGEYATGYVTFSMPSVVTNDVIIPEGTVIVSTDTGLDYVTDSEVIIPVGETSILCSATCMTVGEDGNAEADTITLIEDDYIDVPGLTVNNDEAFTGGTDYEEDDDYRERLLSYLQRDDFGSVGYYENLGNSVDGVHDVHLIDATGYTKKVLVNGDTKPTPSTVLADVLEEFTTPTNLVLGHTFTVDKPTYVTVNLTLNLVVPEEYDEDLITGLVTEFFNGGSSSLDGPEFDGLMIGEPLLKNSFYAAIEMLDVSSVECLHNNDELKDISVDEDEVLKLGTLTINQTVEE